MPGFGDIIRSAMGAQPVQDMQQVEGDPSRGVQMVGSRTGNRAQGYYGQLQQPDQQEAVMSFIQMNNMEPTPENMQIAHDYLMGGQWSQGARSGVTSGAIADQAVAVDAPATASTPGGVPPALPGDITTTILPPQSGVGMGELAAAGVGGVAGATAGRAATRGGTTGASFKSSRTQGAGSDQANINFQRTPADDAPDTDTSARTGGEFKSSRGGSDQAIGQPVPSADDATRAIDTDELNIGAARDGGTFTATSQKFATKEFGDLPLLRNEAGTYAVVTPDGKQITGKDFTALRMALRGAM